MKRLPWVAIGCRSAYLSRFRGLPICDRLPPVAPARLHKRSIPLLRSLMGERIPGARIHVAGVDHLLWRGGRKGKPTTRRPKGRDAIVSASRWRRRLVVNCAEAAV